MGEHFIKINLGNDTFTVDMLDFGDLESELIDKFNNIADDIVEEYMNGDYELTEIQYRLEKMVFYLMVNAVFRGEEKTQEVLKYEVNEFISDRIDQDEWVLDYEEE